MRSLDNESGKTQLVMVETVKKYVRDYFTVGHQFIETGYYPTRPWEQTQLEFLVEYGFARKTPNGFFVTDRGKEILEEDL